MPPARSRGRALVEGQGAKPFLKLKIILYREKNSPTIGTSLWSNTVVEKFLYRVCPKNDPTCFCQNFIKSQPNLIIFGIQILKTTEICPPHIVHVNALPCKMQMLQIVA